MYDQSETTKSGTIYTNVSKFFSLKNLKTSILIKNDQLVQYAEKLESGHVIRPQKTLNKSVLFFCSYYIFFK